MLRTLWFYFSTVMTILFLGLIGLLFYLFGNPFSSDIEKVSKKEKKLFRYSLRTQPVPDIAVRDENGDTLSFREVVQDSQFTYVDCWATWCKPCMIKLPAFVTLSQQELPQNVRVISLSLDYNYQKWKTALREQNLQQIDNYVITSKRTISALGKSLTVDGGGFSIPRYFMVSPEGRFLDSDAPGPQTVFPYLKVMGQR